MIFQPLQGLAKAHLLHVHNQVDGAAAPDALVPVDELGTGDGENTAGGAPLGRVAGIGSGLQRRQDARQRQGAQAVGSGTPVHGSVILARRLTHSFMLKTWLDSVSRSIKAAVR
jgi:hypothetical protein